MMALVVALAGMGEGHLGSPTPASPTCALDQSRACPLPPWPSTYNLSQSSIMYQPWCGAGGAREPGCSTFLNVSWWWTQPSKLDPGSTGPAHWGLLSIDRSESTHMWAGTTYGGATPGDPNTYKSQQAVLANCAWQKAHGWVDRCFVYQNTVNALYDYETIRAVMRSPEKRDANWFVKIRNTNESSGVANYSGLPWQRGAPGRCTPCWKFAPNTTFGDHGEAWCGIPGLNGSDIRATDPQALDCESWSMNWNFTAEGMADFYVQDVLAFVKRGGDGVDGLFMDEITGFPADGGTWDAELLNVSLAEQKSMQNASAHAIQRVIEGLVSDGKYLWHAFQNGNDIGDNTNNNSGHVGGTAHDAAYCTAWMAQRCDTAWVKERAITVQFDKFNVNESIASFLVVRPAYAWIGYGAGQLFPSWNDAFTWDVGEPRGTCKQTAPGVFQRDWTYGTASMDCNTYKGTVPCNPADSKCGKSLPFPPPLPPPPPPPPTPPPPAPPTPPPPSPPGMGWSVAHNCTSCQQPPAKPLMEKKGLSFAACQALCVAHPDCRYMSYVEPELPTSGCSIWTDCGVICLTDHCWHWWVTYEYEARPAPAWNTTACDALPEGPPSPPRPLAAAVAVGAGAGSGRRH